MSILPLAPVSWPVNGAGAALKPVTVGSAADDVDIPIEELAKLHLPSWSTPASSVHLL